MNITLKTLPTASAQEVFDHVANHLLTQKEKSMGMTSNQIKCCYQNPDGLKCAAGCLMGPEEYTSKFEGKGWLTLVAKKKAPEEHVELIYRLQVIHDVQEPKDWRRFLKALAKEYKLSDAVFKRETK